MSNNKNVNSDKKKVSGADELSETSLNNENDEDEDMDDEPLDDIEDDAEEGTEPANSEVIPPSSEAQKEIQ